MQCIILANGEMEDYEKYRSLFAGGPLTICADGGIRHARALGILPQVVVGDMDSVRPEDLEQLTAQDVELIKYPKEKDEMDTELALMEAVKRGATSIVLLGCSGGRLDHTLAAIQMLVPVVEQGVKVQMLAKGHRLTLVTPENPARLPGNPDTILSILPLTTRVTGITSRGVKWPLTDAVFELGKPYGVSNEVTGPEVSITIKEGILLVIEMNSKEEGECPLSM